MSEPEGSGSRADALRPMIVESIGGWRGMLDSGLPVVVFVIANVIGGLGVAIWSALGVGAVLFAIRLLRKQPVQQAISGFFGVAIAAFIAWRMGEARGFFLLGIWRNLVYGGIFVVSLVVRRPLIALIWEFLDASDGDWRRLGPLRRAYYGTTVMWAAVFLARAGVQRFFYDRNATGWLAATSVAMGYPLYVIALGATFLLVRRARKQIATA